MINPFKKKSDILYTLKTFPFTIFFAISTSISASLLVNNNSKQETIIPLLILGLFFSFAITIFFKDRNSKKHETTIQLILIAGLILLKIFIFKNEYIFSTIPGTTLYFHLLILSFLSIFIAPAIKKTDKDNIFGKNINRQLSDISLGITISAGIFAIIMGMIFLISYLFEINLPQNIIIHLFYWCGFVIGTFIICHLSPKKTNYILKEKLKESVQKTFTYIFLPGILIYTAILYAYGLKILITGVWPQNQVALLVLIISILGIATYVENRNLDIKTKLNQFFEKYFFFLLTPNFILIILSLQIRISQYGLTVNRAYLVFFTIWAMALTIYFLVSKAKDLRIIAFSLAIILILTGAGPLSVVNISKYFINKKIQTETNQEKIQDLKYYLETIQTNN
ncbi:MAG: DUF4153 domain-containing protein [Candidatus Gracilibacteria bacterium]|jgi:hypothetical protein|nr:DUF4153 domain-containing protein [Candidatus Gracilibacteria bacterium]